MKILCIKRAGISDELMTQFKNDIRDILRAQGHAMAKFTPKKTYGAAVTVNLNVSKSDIPSFEEKLLSDVVDEHQAQLILTDDWATSEAKGWTPEDTTKIRDGKFYVCSASWSDIENVSRSCCEDINDEFMKLPYAVELLPSKFADGSNPYGNFYLYPVSKTNADKSYNSDYVILSGLIHFNLDVTYVQ